MRNQCRVFFLALRLSSSLHIAVTLYILCKLLLDTRCKNVQCRTDESPLCHDNLFAFLAHEVMPVRVLRPKYLRPTLHVLIMYFLYCSHLLNGLPLLIKKQFVMRAHVMCLILDHHKISTILKVIFQQNFGSSQAYNRWI